MAVPRRTRKIDGYLRGRVVELALPETRATADPLALWATRRIRLDGKPFSFAGHEYLQALYDDPCSHIALSKGAQVGGTVWAVLRSFHACAMGLNTLYLFPTRTDVLDFSRSRVTPLLADNAFLSKMVEDTDTLGLKKVGSAHLYLRGMESRVGLKSVPVDLLIFDELDEATPGAKSMAKERLAHSEYKRIIELSNPSIPDFGIDEVFVRSDRRFWTVKCPGCGHWSAPDKEFPNKLGEDVRIILPRRDGTFYRACPRCGAELDLAKGEWIADYPDRTIHGYRISQLISTKVDPGEILHDYKTTRFPERFFNLKLGRAWADVANRLTADEVLGRCGEHGMQEKSDAPSSMGVDTGGQLHVVISRAVGNGRNRKREVIYIGTRQHYGELDVLMERFQVSRCVIDALPEIHATREFAGRHPGRVYLNYFVESQRGAYHWNHQEHIVQENRTEALDASRQAIREGKVVLPRGGEVIREFANHLAADVKQLKEDEDTGAKSFRYVKTGTNHYSFAFTYDCVAWSVDHWAPTSTGQMSPEEVQRDLILGQRF